MSRGPVRGLAFVDTETTGLGPEASAWEIAITIRNGFERPTGDALKLEEVARSVVIQLEGFEAKHFDPEALEVSGFEQRYGNEYMAGMMSGHEAAEHVALVLKDRHIVAANPAFDSMMLERLLREYLIEPTWHFRLIDVEALAMGAQGWHKPKGLQSTATALGISFDPEAMHTARGDADLARRIYDRVVWGE